MKRWVIVCAVVAVGLIGFIVWYQQFYFHLVSTNPTSGGKATTLQHISFAFNKPLSTSPRPNFAIEPKVEGNISIEGNTFSFIPSTTMKLNQVYHVRLSQIMSQSGDTASDVQFSFTATYIPFSQLNQQNQQEAINQTDSLEKKWPIIQHLPHDTQDYKIDYAVGTNSTITLNITLYPHATQADTYRRQLIQYKQEALSYLTSLGEDPTKYTITYDPAAAAGL